VTDSADTARSGSTIAGIPPGVVDRVLSILGGSDVPVRRRKLLDELERRGTRISLAGLNRILQHCRETGLTTESPDGVTRKARSD
jgi:hypothetical protein